MISVTLRDPFRTTFVVTSTRLGTNRTRSVRGTNYRGLRPNATDYCRINPKFKSFFKRSRTPLIYVLLSVFSLSNLSFILIKSFLFELNNINFDSFFFFVADYTHLPVFFTSVSQLRAAGATTLFQTCHVAFHFTKCNYTTESRSRFKDQFLQGFSTHRKLFISTRRSSRLVGKASAVATLA